MEFRKKIIKKTSPKQGQYVTAGVGITTAAAMN